MKLFEVFSSGVEKDNWIIQNMTFGGIDSYVYSTSFQTSSNEKFNIMAQFAEMPDIHEYVNYMSMTGEITTHNIDDLLDELNASMNFGSSRAVTNIGFGVTKNNEQISMNSMQTKNWGDNKVAFKVISTIVDMVIDYDEQMGSSGWYVIGSTDAKKLKMFAKIISKYVSHIHMFDDLKSISTHSFMFFKK